MAASTKMPRGHRERTSPARAGFFIFMGNEALLERGEVKVLVSVERTSRKLARVCRSSLSAEAQSAADGVGQLDWAKIYITLSINPTLDPLGREAACTLGQSPVVTDPEGLYGDSLSTTSGLGISEKRTAIEVKIDSDRMKAISAYWCWANSFQQLADGLTKVASRQALADALRRGTRSLRYDPDYVAGKKVTQKQTRREGCRARPASHRPVAPELKERKSTSPKV